MSAEQGTPRGAHAADDDDRTIVVPAGDETVVVPMPRDAQGPAPDATIVVPGRHGESEQRPTGAGLDPRRPIAPAPATTPWADLPTPERGLSQGLPVSYGARPHGAPALQTGVDEVQRRLGAAPGPGHATVRPGREQLPSLVKRARRRRLRTLVGYVAVVLVSAIGLWGVAAIAFGW